MRPCLIARLYISGQSIRRIIGNLYRFFLCIERNHGQYRSENFLTRDCHVIVYIGKNGWTRIITAVQTIRATNTASDEACTFINTYDAVMPATTTSTTTVPDTIAPTTTPTTTTPATTPTPTTPITTSSPTTSTTVAPRTSTPFAPALPIVPPSGGVATTPTTSPGAATTESTPPPADDAAPTTVSVPATTVASPDDPPADDPPADDPPTITTGTDTPDEIFVDIGDPIPVDVDCAGDLVITVNGVVQSRVDQIEPSALGLGDHVIEVECDGEQITSVRAVVFEQDESSPAGRNMTVIVMFVVMASAAFLFAPSASGRRRLPA